MNNETPTNDSPTNGAASAEPQTGAIELAETGLHAGGTLTNADIAALSRERQQTLLSILPPAVAAILITNRPPMPPHVEYQAHKKLVAALAKARGEIPSVPMDKTVDYVSKRTGERVHYRSPSRGSCSSASSTTRRSWSCSATRTAGSTCPGCRCPTRPTSRTWPRRSRCGAATSRCRLIAIVADEDTGERDIPEPQKPARQRKSAQGQQRRAAAPVSGSGGGGAAGNRQPQPGADQLKNRTDALLAKLPKDVADQLREQHKDPSELLRRTTEEVNRRNAAASRGGNAPADGNGTAQPASEQPGSGTPPASDSGTPPDARLEKTINDGMRALRLSADEQTELREQFPNDPQGLLDHIKALYSAGQEKPDNA